MPQLPGLRGCLGAAWAGRLQGGSRRLLGLGVLPLQGLQYGLQSLGKHCDDLFLSFPLATVQSSQLVLGGLVSLHLLERAGTFPVHRCWLPGGQKTFGWNCGWCYLNSRHVSFFLTDIWGCLHVSAYCCWVCLIARLQLTQQVSEAVTALTTLTVTRY